MSDRTKELLDLAEKGILDVFESQKYREYLTAMSKFHSYSARNVALILAAQPDASMVAGFKKWNKEFGRYVKKGEKGIPIIGYSTKRIQVPATDSKSGEIIRDDNNKPKTVEKKIPQYYVTHVFDVSQTDGDPLPSLTSELTNDVDGMERLKQALSTTSSYTIKYADLKDSLKGYCHFENEEIVIKEGMAPAQTLKTTIHEIVHAELHQPGQNQGTDRRTAEVQAESVAYVVCDHYGVDTSEYTFPYLAAWSSGKELRELQASLNIIRDKADDLITRIDAQLHELSKAIPYCDQYALSSYAKGLSASETKLIAALEQAYAIPESDRVTRWFGSLNLHQIKEGNNDGIIKNRIEKALRLIEMTQKEYAESDFSRQPSNEIEKQLSNKKNFMASNQLTDDMAAAIRQETAREAAALGVSVENYLASGLNPQNRVYHILQLQPGEENHHRRFVTSEELKQMGQIPQLENYHEIYSGIMPEGATLENLYQQINQHPPKDYLGYSLSHSDIVIVEQAGNTTANYVDLVGYTQYPEFARQYELQKARETIENQHAPMQARLDAAEKISKSQATNKTDITKEAELC